MALTMVLLLDLAATLALAGLRQTHTLLKGGGLRRERSRNTKRHRKRQHKSRDQQRNALSHLLTSSPYFLQNKTGLPLTHMREIAGCATGSTCPSQAPIFREAGFKASI